MLNHSGILKQVFLLADEKTATMPPNQPETETNDWNDFHTEQDIGKSNLSIFISGS